MLPSLPVRLLRKPSSSPVQAHENTITTLTEICSGRVGVIDFWHTKCTRCPAAIEKLNALAENFGSTEDVLWFTCALSLGDGNGELVSEVIQEDSWSALHHLFLEEHDKETCKSVFGYSAVPYYAVFDHTGKICQCGEPKSMDLVDLFTTMLQNKSLMDSAVKSSNNNGLSFDDDF